MTLIKKRTVLKMIASAMGSVVTVSAFKYADVGAVDDISLQSPVSSLEIIEPYVPDNVPTVSTPVADTSKTMRRDAVQLEANTLTVSSDDLENTEEILDESTFTYDGSEVWVNVNLANVREEPAVESEILDQIEYGSSLVRISYGTLWSKVRLEDGTEGYIMSSLLDEEEIVAPTPHRLLRLSLHRNLLRFLRLLLHLYPMQLLQRPRLHRPRQQLKLPLLQLLLTQRLSTTQQFMLRVIST